MRAFSGAFIVTAALVQLLPSQILALDSCIDPSPLCTFLRNGPEPCKQFEDAGDEKGWYQCQCEDGAAAIRSSCNACEDTLTSFQHWEKQCADNGFSLAPISKELLMGLEDFPPQWLDKAGERPVPQPSPQPAVTPAQPQPHVDLRKRQEETEKSVVPTDRTVLTRPTFLSSSPTESVSVSASSSAGESSTSRVDTGVISSQDETPPTLTGDTTITLETPETTVEGSGGSVSLESGATASGTGAGSAANVQFVQGTGVVAIVAGTMSFGLMLLL